MWESSVIEDKRSFV